MKAKSWSGALIILASLPVASCNCDDTVTASGPQFRTDRSSIPYGLVCLESDNVLEVKLVNNGAGEGTVSWEVVPADGSGEFDHLMFETSPEQKKPLLVGAGETLPITVTYHPSDAKAGEQSQLEKVHKAILRLTTDDDENKTIDVLIDGTVSAQQPTPILSIECGADTQLCPAGDGKPCCTSRVLMKKEAPDLGRSVLTLASLGAVPALSAREMKVKVSNLGCGQLTLSKDWVFDNILEGDPRDCGQDAIAVPELENGITIAGSPTQADIKSADLTLHFTPSGEACQFGGYIQLATNDPVIPTDTTTAKWANLFTTGEGTLPVLSADPRELQYGEVEQGVCKVLPLRLRNTSALDLTVDDAQIIAGGDGSATDYDVKRVWTLPACDAIEVDQTLPYVLPPYKSPENCGPDELFVDMEYCPGKSNTRNPDNDQILFYFADGSLAVELNGGSRPQMVVAPGANLVNWFKGPQAFGCLDCDPTFCPAVYCSGAGDCGALPDACLEPPGGGNSVCAESAGCVQRCGRSFKEIQICNVGKGDLTIDDVRIDGGGAKLQIVDGNCTAAAIHKDACCQMTVLAEPGEQESINASLVIESNDDTWPGSTGIGFLLDEYEPPHADFVASPESGAGNLLSGTWLTLDGTPPISTNAVEFVWEVLAVAKDSEIPLGVIDPGTHGPEFDFPTPSHSILKFMPDVGGKQAPVNYQIKLTVNNGTCDPPDDDFTTQILDVWQP